MTLGMVNVRSANSSGRMIGSATVRLRLTYQNVSATETRNTPTASQRDTSLCCASTSAARKVLMVAATKAPPQKSNGRASTEGRGSITDIASANSETGTLIQ